MDDTSFVDANIGRFVGFADTYDRYRPQPPATLIPMLIGLLGSARPRLVVDLGSGTGLSTRVWAEHADAVLGIEPGDDMRQQAQQATPQANVTYQHGFSTATGLPDACADLVTCSQALHWMEPEPTFAEVARVLRPGGIFAAYDCDWPPVVAWEVAEAFIACLTRAVEVERARGLNSNVRSWDKHQHLTRMRASGWFRFTREILLHSEEQGDAERIVGLVKSQGQVATMLRNGASEAELGIDTLRTAAERYLGTTPGRWYLCYRVRLGVV